MVKLSSAFNPLVLKGIKVYPDNPFRFDFVLSQGDKESTVGADRDPPFLKQESTKLIKYFLAALTTPEKDMWVNLSPNALLLYLGTIDSFTLHVTIIKIKSYF